ncbi:phosphotransferase [Metabacillus sp. HB246100]
MLKWEKVELFNEVYREWENMDLHHIIDQLITTNILPSRPTSYEQLNGGTVSELYRLNLDELKLVVKKNNPQMIKSEADFLRAYKEVDLLPKLLFVDSSYEYIVYSYIEGRTKYVQKNKKDTLQALVCGLLNNYQPVESSWGWGWMDEPSDSWQEFILHEIDEANKLLLSQLDSHYYKLVVNLVKKMPKRDLPFLLHGDCGIHNFIFTKNQLSGVIDPSPVLGDPLYDLIYAFCSSPHDLTTKTIDGAATLLKCTKQISQEKLYEEVLIVLYLRLAKCLKHHPSDFQEYLEAWDDWEKICR